MSNQTNGLRFDVYERVHLPDDVAAIDELEEIELVPRIQIVQQGEQVLLKGHLLLTGVYRAENESAVDQALEHWIPVEITLPLNRVHRLDDISVEIDNFDVDLLSARTLNITGVLSLLGIEIDQPREQDEWPREEPFVVVHKREEEERNQSGIEEQEEVLEYSPGQQENTETSAPVGDWPSYPSFGESLNREQAQREAAEREREAAQRETEIRQAQQWEYAAQLAEAQREAVEQETLQRESIARAAFLREEQLLAEARKNALQPEPILFEQERQERFENQEIREIQEQQRQELELQEQQRQEREIQQLQERERLESEVTERERYLNAEAQTNRKPEQILYAQDQASLESTKEPAPQIQAAFSSDTANVSTPAPESELEKKEPRIALGSKRIEEEKAPAASGFGFHSLLQSSRREQEARVAAEQVAEKAAAEAKKSTGDDIEWKNLFYGRSNDDHSFRKLKLCIVQREETLEAIAGRYQMQPREIILYNRLVDQSVSEGQVLYIP